MIGSLLAEVNDQVANGDTISKLLSISIPLNMVWALELVLVLGVSILPHLLLW